MGTLKNIHKLQGRADEIMAHEGNEKGLGLISSRNTYIDKIGENKLKEIQKGMEKLGYPFDFFELKPFSWYQASYLPLSVLVARHLLGWKDEDVYSMGEISATQSPILRTIMRLVSMKFAFNNVTRLWGSHFDFGKMEGVEYNKEEEYIRIRVYDYSFGGVMLPYMRGYFAGFVDRIVGEGSAEVTHSSCPSEMETEVSCDEFLLDW